MGLFLTSLTRVCAGALVIRALVYLWGFWDYPPMNVMNIGLIASTAVLTTDVALGRMLNRNRP